MRTDLPPETAQALRGLAEAAGGYITCLIDGSNDMEARA
ncbi:MAG: hypothetical protein JWO67_149, partial [Streptosporangiaceae bacterium]|nr:hypothetical protein [Streptosporangiaceae bacterium]